jgi:hypothetical protein
MFGKFVESFVLAANQRKRAFQVLLAFIGLCLLGAVANAGTIATDPNSVLSGYTALQFNDYENAYDSNGNIVPVTGPGARNLQPGDTLQGVFVVTDAQSQGGDYYIPQLGNPYVEITGVFDEYVSAFVTTGSEGAGYYVLTPDTTSTLGSKAISGATFQSTYGTGSMIALFSNNNDAMSPDILGNGLSTAPYNTTSGAWSLATTGAKWVTFGSLGESGTTGWGSDYYWAANQTAPGSANYGASLALIENLSTIPSNAWTGVNEPPPQNAPGSLGSMSNPFAFGGATYIGGTVAGQNLAGTAFTTFSSDPAQVDIVPQVPEPSSLGLIATFLGALTMLRAYRGKLSRGKLSRCPRRTP